MARHAIVSGGSIGGLFAAAALIRAGWTVAVLERTEVELRGRGAGIVTHDLLRDALETVGAGTRDLGVAVTERVAFDIEGRRVSTIPFPQIVTSWDRVHQLLRATMPEGAYHLGRTVTGYEAREDRVVARLSDGSTAEADLLVGADGFRSAIRGQMFPDTQPIYSGYVVWRALAAEADLPPAIRANVFPAFGFFLPAGTQIIGYPIAGPDNDLRPGHRRYNFVWYAPAGPEELDDMLTDASGHRHNISIPPPLVRDAVLDRMREDAARMLPIPFVEILTYSERPFFTPIYDFVAPEMASGRIALVGDAACQARLHIGMGVTKAACDALALARHAAESNLVAGLQAYSAERWPASEKAMLRTRELGGYIFGPDPATNPDGRRNPKMDEVMRTTAITVE